MKLGKLVGGALAVAVGTAAGAWAVGRVAKTISESVAEVLNEATSAVGHVADSMSRLILPIESLEQVDQQTVDQYEQGAILTPADEFQRELDGDDWTDRAQAELDPRMTPEKVILPIEDRQIADLHPNSPMMGMPDLSGEDL